MKNWKLTSLVGLTALGLATTATAEGRHGHGSSNARGSVYYSMKVLDKETDHLKAHFRTFMHRTNAARRDRHYIDLLSAINSFEKHADHIRSAYENRRGFNEIAREVAAARKAASRVDALMHDHLRIPPSIDNDYHAACDALKKVAASYSRRHDDRRDYDRSRRGSSDHRFDGRRSDSRADHGRDRRESDYESRRGSRYSETDRQLSDFDRRRILAERLRSSGGLSIRFGR